jgi:hypothetical protein
VREKLRGGYKDVEDAARRKAIAAIQASLPTSGVESRAKKSKVDAPASIKHRVDFDKACELVCFLTARVLAMDLAKPCEMLGALLSPQEVFGDDVCYGPVSLVSAATVAAVAPRVAAIDELQLEAAMDAGGFPDVLGALCDIFKARDLEYALIHFRHLKAILNEAAVLECGLLLHFW